MIIITTETPLSLNKSLVIQLTLTGNLDEQKKVLKKKAKNFASQVCKKGMTKQLHFGCLGTVLCPLCPILWLLPNYLRNNGSK